jgi:hypothetical protein
VGDSTEDGAHDGDVHAVGVLCYSLQ